MRLLFLSLVVLVINAAPPPPNLRLGNQVYPNRYSADLTLDPDKESFAGNIEIGITLREPISLMWLNGTDLEIQKATISRGPKTFQAAVEPGGDDFVGLSWPQSMPEGEAVLNISYRGKVPNKNNQGLFRVEEAGSRYIVSQFQTISARRAFPCFDEPGFKTPWQITVHVPASDLAFSNTPIQAESVDADGVKTVRFWSTKPLPSYLIALAVGPFEVVNAGTAGRNHVPLRVIIPKGRKAEASYVTRVIPEFLSRLETYFDIPYPFEKLDSVAVPHFSGEMENAGLITYNEAHVLAKPENESLRFQRFLASVVAHEMAHQWFGDLVTMAWWNDTWLNEAFATWMSSTIVRQWKPEWHSEITDLQSRLGAARVDGLPSARRITQPAETKSDISNAFDSITYEKGGAVIGMFEANAGRDTFRKGVQSYLRAHANGNTRAEDFLSALSTAGSSDIGTAFRTFLDQPGIPEISVRLRCVTGQTPVALVSQVRAQPLGSTLPPQSWQVPVCMKFGTADSVAQQCFLLKEKTAELTLSVVQSCPDWVMPNAEGRGYYRVNYAGDSLKALLEGTSDQLSLVEQVSVLQDVIASTASGAISPGEALSIVPIIAKKQERELIEGAIQLVFLGGSTFPENLRPNLARFIKQVLGPRASELGWLEKKGESEDARLLRAALVPLVAGNGQDEVLISEARNLALKWLGDHRSLTPDILPSLLLVAANRAGDRKLFDQYRAAALASKDDNEQQMLVRSMGFFRDREIAQAALQETLRDDFDPRVSTTILYSVGNVSVNRRMPFEFVQAHYDELVAKAPKHGIEDWASRLPYTALNFCSAEEEREVEAFFAPRSQKQVGGPRILAQVLESIRGCTARKAKQQDSLRAFFERY